MTDPAPGRQRLDVPPPTPADFAVDNASRPWDPADDAGYEHLDHFDDDQEVDR